MSPEVEHFDVIVVGYGPGAQTLAAQLAKLGRKVCALERYPHLYNLPRAGHIDHEAIRIAQSVGDVQPAVETMWEVRDTYYWLNAEGKALMKQPAHEPVDAISGWFSDYSMWQPNFERVLEEGAREFGAEVRLGWEAVSVEQHARPDRGRRLPQRAGARLRPPLADRGLRPPECLLPGRRRRREQLRPRLAGDPARGPRPQRGVAGRRPGDDRADDLRPQHRPDLRSGAAAAGDAAGEDPPPLRVDGAAGRFGRAAVAAGGSVAPARGVRRQPGQPPDRAPGDLPLPGQSRPVLAPRARLHQRRRGAHDAALRGPGDALLGARLGQPGLEARPRAWAARPTRFSTATRRSGART